MKLNKRAPKKRKWIRENNQSNMNKSLRQAIMKRLGLNNNKTN